MKAALEEFRQSLLGKTRDELVETAVALFRELSATRADFAALKEVHTGIVRECQKAREANGRHEAEIDALRKQNRHLTGVETLRTSELFGRSSEKTGDLLDKAAAGGRDDADPISEDAADDGSERAADAGVDGMDESGVRGLLKKILGEKERKKKGKGRRDKDLSKLPVRETYVYDVQALNDAYGDTWRIVGWNRTRTVETARSCTYLQITYDPKIETTTDCRVLSPFKKEPLIEKSLASSSLAASIFKDKYGMCLPYYRQENDPGRFGFPISRQTMSHWEIHICGEFFVPVYGHLKTLMRVFEYQHCDETPWLVVRDGKNHGSKGYMWVHLSGELLEGFKVAVIAFEPTRAAKHLTDFFGGVGHPIHLTDDAYSGYYTLQNSLPDVVTICGCLTHCRRRFVDAATVLRLKKGTTADELADIPEYRCLFMIAEIYKVDEPLKAMTAEERLNVRREKEEPLFDKFIDYIKSIDTSSPETSETFKDAVSYALNHEKELRQYLSDGNVPIDNGHCERLIRSIARLRVNSLFSTTKRGAETSAVMLTLMLTAELNDADSYYYLKYLMDELPKHLYQNPSEYMDDMMPWTEKYREYEKSEKQRMINCMSPPAGTEKPDIKKIKAEIKGAAKDKIA